jgi:hypothetical protein
VGFCDATEGLLGAPSLEGRSGLAIANQALGVSEPGYTKGQNIPTSGTNRDQLGASLSNGIGFLQTIVLLGDGAVATEGQTGVPSFEGRGSALDSVVAGA